MVTRAFMTPKESEGENDCQDRFSINGETASVAVCDGMSQSLFPKYWAEILARKYTSERDWIPSRENVHELSHLWVEKVSSRMEEMRSLGLSTWRAENMLMDGFSAGSTLVGLRMDGNRFRCDVLGDSCLVIVKGGRIQDILSSMDCFGYYPDYFDSDPSRPGRGELRTFGGEVAPGMVFLLVTDPLAEYLTSARGSLMEQTLVSELLSVETQEEFEILVAYWRQAGMHNDDTTMVIVWQQA